MTAPGPAIEAWSLALEFLREAEYVPAAVVPRMAIHAAYYAMFHGARAVLINLDGPLAPTKHNAVVGRFGFHARAAGDPAMLLAGRMLNELQTERLRSDYHTASTPQPGDAASAVSQSRDFLAACARLLGLPAPPLPATGCGG